MQSSAWPALGLTVRQVAQPVAAYVPAVGTGRYVYTSGQLPMVDGALAGHRHGRCRGEPRRRRPAVPRRAP